MANDLILFDNSFEVKHNKILSYVYSNTIFEKKTDLEYFIYCLSELYRIPIFVPVLNAIITQLKRGNAVFKVQPLKSYDRVLGHCTTATKEVRSQESTFKNGIFSKHYTIVIKKIIPDIIIHEIGHAVEHISGINVNGDFKKALYEDLRLNNTHLLQVKSAVKDIMEQQLKNYKLENHMAELFARYFELVAMSREVGDWGDYQFYYNDIINYFMNTTTWVNNILIPILNKNTDDDVAALANDFVANLKPYKKEWVRNNRSRFADVDDMNNKWVESITKGREDAEVAKSFEKFFEGKEINKLDNGVEYFEFKKNK
ncbi:MAG: hypothetical protein IJ853_00425 [Rickettsiales bacterium]|nr:hypothetical protein [Rickettsiales bacterium]